MRVFLNKSTGRMIESQSGGETHPDPEIDDEEYAAMNLNTLLQNAIGWGYKAEDIEVKFVTNEEFAVLMEATRLPPTEERIYEEKIKLRMRELAIESLKVDEILPVVLK